MNRSVIAKGVEVVGILFTAFGGFLAGVAPPQAADSRFAVGLASFLALITLFAITALTREGHRRAWIIAGCSFLLASMAAAYWYWSNSLAYTFEYPPGNTEVEHIAGTELTEDAQAYLREHPTTSNARLVARFGGLQSKDKVWPPESVRGARTRLVASYVLLVLSIATAIFALVEGALGSGAAPGDAPSGN